MDELFISKERKLQTETTNVAEAMRNLPGRPRHERAVWAGGLARTLPIGK